MDLNQKLTPSRMANATPPPVFSTVPLKSDKVSSSLSAVEEVTKSDRKLAWQVAPNLFLSFKYAWLGLHYAFVTQRNFRIHTFIAVVVISLGLGLQISLVEMSILGLLVAAVLTLELLNTAIESVVDLTVKQSYHELAKIAKDCAAGAVLVSAIAAIFVGGMILLPPLFALIVSL